MIYSTATVPVNPAGESLLTRAQVWAGLVLKARDARLFLPPGLCTRCDVTEESATHFVREATIAGADLREIIMLEPRSKVTFFQASGPREGVIVNELFEDTVGELQLRFYCYIGLRGKEPNGSEEQAEQAQFDSDNGYKATLLSTLKRTRELLAEGTLHLAPASSSRVTGEK
jgi:hypothetical protein